MTIQTLHMALPFKRTADGHLTAYQASECASSEHAAAEASSLAARFGGAVAFTRAVDPASGRSDTRLIRAVGEVPRLDYLLG